MTEIVVKDHGIEVVEAPVTSRISLELVAKSDRGLTVNGARIIVGTYPTSVTYRVVGWDPIGALIVEREP